MEKDAKILYKVKVSCPLAGGPVVSLQYSIKIEEDIAYISHLCLHI